MEGRKHNFWSTTHFPILCHKVVMGIPGTAKLAHGEARQGLGQTDTPGWWPVVTSTIASLLYKSAQNTKHIFCYFLRVPCCKKGWQTLLSIACLSISRVLGGSFCPSSSSEENSQRMVNPEFLKIHSPVREMKQKDDHPSEEPLPFVEHPLDAGDKNPLMWTVVKSTWQRERGGWEG